MASLPPLLLVSPSESWSVSFQESFPTKDTNHKRSLRATTINPADTGSFASFCAMATQYKTTISGRRKIGLGKISNQQFVQGKRQARLLTVWLQSQLFATSVVLNVLPPWLLKSTICISSGCKWNENGNGKTTKRSNARQEQAMTKGLWDTGQKISLPPWSGLKQGFKH